jgi:hypothetical protein
MKTSIDTSSSTGPEAAELPAVLSQWYAANPAVRRLWAVEDSFAVRIHLTLEPTLDGPDTLPVWLAHCHNWTRDLQLLTNRDVQLRLVDADVFAGSPMLMDETLLAELHWRDPMDDILTG